jgi:hypothetical protein
MLLGKWVDPVQDPRSQIRVLLARLAQAQFRVWTERHVALAAVDAEAVDEVSLVIPQDPEEQKEPASSSSY